MSVYVFDIKYSVTQDFQGNTHLTTKQTSESCSSDFNNQILSPLETPHTAAMRSVHFIATLI